LKECRNASDVMKIRCPDVVSVDLLDRTALYYDLHVGDESHGTTGKAIELIVKGVYIRSYRSDVNSMASIHLYSRGAYT
jgi:hypothetical protein